MATVGFIGFETGSTSEFATYAGVSTVVTGTRTGGGGNYMLQTPGTQITSQPSITLDTSGSVMYAQAYFMFPVVTAPTTNFTQQIIEFWGAGIVLMGVGVQFLAAGGVSLKVMNTSQAVVGTQTFVPVANQWYCLGVYFNNTGLTATSGICEVKLDNVVQAGLSLSSQNFGTAVCSVLKMIRTSGSAQSYVFNMDDVVVDNTAYPSFGCTVIARGPKAGTPTYNAFTKSNVSTIDTVWNDTPFNTTTYATGTASTKQSALIGSFSATQTSTSGTSRGTGIIAASDTIISLRTGVVAKSSVATTSNDQLITRLAAVDTLSTIASVTTADTYIQTPAIAAPTLTNLNAMEAGFSTGTTAATRTIEDLWVQVVYLKNAVVAAAKGATLMMMGV